MGPFNVSENLGYRNFLCIIGVSRFAVEKFLVSHCQETSWGSPSVSQKISGMEKNLWIRRRRGFTFFRRKCLSQSFKKILSGTLRCFRESRVSKKLMHTGGGWGRMVLRFSVGKFLVSFSEKPRRGPFSVCQNFGYRKAFCMRRYHNFQSGRGGSTIFCRLCFVSQVPKLFVGDPFCVSEKFWYRKFSA